jgi:hypothetical protein
VVLEKNREDQFDWSCGNEVLHRGKDERNILHIIKQTRANWIGYFLRRSFLHNTLTKDRKKGQADDKEDVISCWMTLTL